MSCFQKGKSAIPPKREATPLSTTPAKKSRAADLITRPTSPSGEDVIEFTDFQSVDWESGRRYRYLDRYGKMEFSVPRISRFVALASTFVFLHKRPEIGEEERKELEAKIEKVRTAFSQQLLLFHFCFEKKRFSDLCFSFLVSFQLRKFPKLCAQAGIMRHEREWRDPDAVAFDGAVLNDAHQHLMEFLVRSSSPPAHCFFFYCGPWSISSPPFRKEILGMRSPKGMRDSVPPESDAESSDHEDPEDRDLSKSTVSTQGFLSVDQ